MKCFILIAGMLIAFTSLALAQKTFSKADFNKHLGKTGTLCDTVYSLHVFNDTLTVLNMGGAFPNQKYRVVIKGNKVNLNWTNLKGKRLCITGVFELYNEMPAIEVTEPDQINLKMKE